MTQSYVGPAYFPRPCRCHAHSQHRLLKWLHEHPRGSLVLAALDLHVTYANVKQLNHRLRQRPDFSRLCPECSQPALFSGVCQKCGFEPSATRTPVVAFDTQSPTNWIHPGNQLGSVTNYRGLHFGNHPAIVKRWAEDRIEEPLVKACKSDVMNWLKFSYPEEGITDVAGRLVVKEVRDLQARWPHLTTSKHARMQVVENVIAALKLSYPNLRNGDRVTPAGKGVSPEGGMKA